MDNVALEKMIRDVMLQMGSNSGEAPKTCAAPQAGGQVDYTNYPLSEKMTDKIKSPTGKALSDITLEGLMKGEITSDDVKIAPETLEMQAQVAESIGRKAFARNLRRAAELIAIPDDRVLEIYNAMRPNRSTKAELIAIAEEVETKYDACINAAFIRECADVYERRNILKK